VVFMCMKGFESNADEWVVNVFGLYRCNFWMAFGVHKGASAKRYLMLEKEKGIFNPCFHVIICNRLANQVKSLRYRTRQVEFIREIKDCIESISEVYKARQMPFLLTEALSDLLYETVLTMEKVQEGEYRVLVSAVELLLDECKGKSLVKVLISLEILIENDEGDQLGQMLAPKTWSVLQRLLGSDDPVIARNAHDVFTYFLISSQKIPFLYTYNAKALG